MSGASTTRPGRIELGGQCNNNCAFCHANIDRPGLELESLLSAIAAACKKEATSLHLTGGELTIRKDLRKVLDFLRKTGVPWSLATNGRFFSVAGNVVPFVKSGLARAVVSLHGPEELHDMLAGTDGYGQTRAGIANLLAAGVDVELATIATRELVDNVAPAEFAASAISTGCRNLTVRPPQLAACIVSRQETLVPGLAALAEWTARFIDAVQARLDVLVKNVPHCIFARNTTKAAGRVARPAWPCRNCERRDRCPGFAMARWQPGDVDLLRPLSFTRPGHLRYRPGNLLRGFDIAACPIRARTRKPPAGPESVLLATEAGVRVWRPSQPVAEPVAADAKLTYGQVWLADEKLGPVPLVRAAPCKDCPRIFECPTCFVPGVPAAPPTTPTRGLSRRSFGDWEHRVYDGAGDLAADLAEPVREAWLVPRGAAMPDRPQPSDPVDLMDSLRESGLVPVSYQLPGPDRRTLFVASVVRKDRAPSRFYAQHHEGMSLQITESCMCRCVMCNIVGYFKTPLMPYRKVLTTLAEAGLLGMRLVDLFGGEVTLRKDLIALIRHVKWLGRKCMFITTGYYVTPSFVRRVKEAGVDRVVVSIDGSRAEIHDPIRQLRGIFDRAVRALRALSKEPAIETFSSTVILSENLWDLPDLIRLSGRIGIKKHEFFLPISGPVSSTIPRWPNRDKMEVFFDEILPEVEEVAAKVSVKVDFRPEIRTWKNGQERTIDMVSAGLYNTHANNPESRCQAPGFNLFVTVNGNVYPCDMPSVISASSALGNLESATLLDIAASEAMEEFAKEAGHYPACRMCVGRYEAVR